ncbi:hypothetical protein SLE2022_107360 [Rubroshorea leprosula]
MDLLKSATQDLDLPTTAGAASDKKHSVCAGIDVFERPVFCAANRHSEWQVNTALEKIKQNDISAAIFTPGWLYEHLGKDQFVTNQNKQFTVLLVPGTHQSD